MAGLGRKVFASGDILLASEVQGFLQDQAVMVFDDDAARTAAIATPTEGMVTFRKDDNALEVFDGSTFVAVGGGAEPGLVHIESQTPSAVAAVNFNDVFTSTFRNYVLIFDLVLSATPALDLRLREGGVDNTGGSYSTHGQKSTTGATAYAAFATGGQSSFRLVESGVAGDKSGFVNIYAPQLGKSTLINGTQTFLSSTSGAGVFAGGVLSGGFNSTFVADGFTLFVSSGNFTGVVSIFGVTL